VREAHFLSTRCNTWFARVNEFWEQSGADLRFDAVGTNPLEETPQVGLVILWLLISDAHANGSCLRDVSAGEAKLNLSNGCRKVQAESHFIIWRGLEKSDVPQLTDQPIKLDFDAGSADRACLELVALLNTFESRTADCRAETTYLKRPISSNTLRWGRDGTTGCQNGLPANPCRESTIVVKWAHGVVLEPPHEWILLVVDVVWDALQREALLPVNGCFLGF